MSVHGMKPTFTNREEYQMWLKDWKALYAYASLDSKTAKRRIKHLQRLIPNMSEGDELNEVRKRLSALQREKPYKRVTARKLLTVLDEARIRWSNIVAMKNGIEEQAKEFPLEVETRNIDFHFNKKSMEFDFIPMWVVKARGKSYYCNSVVSNIGFSTRENPEHPSTKGSLRIKRGTLKIDADGNAEIV